MEENTLIKNPKNGESIQLLNSENIIQQTKCQICSKYKTINDKNFHKYELKISNKTIKYEYIDVLCKECLPLEFVKWDFGELKPKINYENFKNYYINYYKQNCLSLTGYKFEDLLSITAARDYLNYKDDKDVRERAIKGFIKSVRVPYSIYQIQNGEYRISFYNYYPKQEIEKLKYWKNNGKFIRKYSRLNETLPISEFPYIQVSPMGIIYLFINKTEQKRPCVKCFEIKDFNCFYISKNGSISNQCNECSKKDCKKWYKSLDHQRKKEHLIQVKEWIRTNRPKVREYHKKYRKSKIIRLKYAVRHRANDVLNKIRSNKQNPLFIRKFGKTKTVLRHFGCSYPDLVKHIESKFIDGMSWENYGPGYLVKDGKPVYDENNNIVKIKQWHVDHIKPVSKFDLTKIEELVKINHYTNLQPLWAKDNIEKSDIWDKNDYFDPTELFTQEQKELIDEYNKIKESIIR